MCSSSVLRAKRTLSNHAPSPGSDRLPVAAAGEKRAAQAFAFEPATSNDADAPMDAGRFTNNDRRSYVGQQNEKWPDA